MPHTFSPRNCHRLWRPVRERRTPGVAARPPSFSNGRLGEKWRSNRVQGEPAVPRRPGRQPAAAARGARGPGATRRAARSPPPSCARSRTSAIAEAVREVEGLGMRSVTDGEFRRAWFHLDFLQQLDGVAVTGNIAASSDAATTVHLTPPKLSVIGPLRHVRDIQVDDFRYLASIVTETPKVSIPSPTMVHFRGGRAAIDLDAYPDLEQVLRRPGRVLPRRARRPLRGRLPLRAARRHQPRLPLRPGDARRRRRAGRGSRRRSPTPTPS